MVKAILSGESKKVDGTFRQWDCVEYHKDIDEIKCGYVLHVIEKGNVRLLNMSMFTGTVLCNEKELNFFMGECLSKEVYDLMLNLPF